MIALISGRSPLDLAVTAVTVTPAEMSVPQLVMNCFAPLTIHFPSRSSLRGQLKVQPTNLCTARPGRSATSVAEEENFHRPADGHQRHDPDRDEAPPA